MQFIEKERNKMGYPKVEILHKDSFQRGGLIGCAEVHKKGFSEIFIEGRIKECNYTLTK